VLLIRRPEKDAPEQAFRFQTQSKLRILPIALEAIDIFRTKTRSFKLLFKFTAGFPRNDDIGDVSLYVNHLNDLMSSMTVLYALKSHVRGASVVFDKAVAEDTPSTPCEVRFGSLRGGGREIDPFEHPLQRARAFLHCPQQELYLHAKGIHPPRNWKTFTLCLDVDESWPTELRLTPDSFQLHVVPLTNLRKDTADPIEHDATRERHPVQHHDRASRYVFHSLAGVYRTSDQGLVPLEPSVVGSGRASYELFSEGHDDERRAWLALDMPGAFEEPQRVVVDAYWHQPALSELRASDMRVRLGDRFIDGIDWSCSGPIVGHVEGDLEDDRDGLLQLVSIKNQRFLGRDELVFLLTAIGAGKERTFAKIVRAIDTVTVTSKPFARKSAGFKYVYDISFRDLDPSDLPRLDPFCNCLLSVLAAWSVEEVVELVARLPNLSKQLPYV
jgi:type VI secretion system protein ImpG